MATLLNGTQREGLRDALLAAFPTWDALAEMFHVVFGEPLQNRVADGRPMLTVASDLIVWVQDARKLDQLLDGALGQNPGNLQLRAVVEAVRRTPAALPAVAGSVALGELVGGGEVDRCVYVAAIVYDLAAAKTRVREHVERASRRPDVVRMPGAAAARLRSRGYEVASFEGAIFDSFTELIAAANDMRVFATIAPVATSKTKSQDRRRFLGGLLGERFKKRDHGITRVLALRDRVADTVAAVELAWARSGNVGAAPSTDAEAQAADALCGLCDVLATVVRRAHAGEAPIPPEVRAKIVHIYDHDSRRNYSPVKAFP